MCSSGPRRSASSPRGGMSAGCLCGRGSGTVHPDSFAAMPGSRAGTVLSTAAGSSFAGDRIAANGATIVPFTPSVRLRSGRPAPHSRDRTRAWCARRGGLIALPPPSNGRTGSRSRNRRLGTRRKKTGGPERRERQRPSRGAIDRAARRPGRKEAGGSCRSGRRQGGVRIRGRAARRSAETAVATTADDGTIVVVTGVAATGVVATAVAATVVAATVVAAVAGGADPR